MWHKVSPQAFRIPYIKNWTSQWYTTKTQYPQQVKIDNTIRNYLKKEFRDIPTGDVVIGRNDKEILVTVFTAKASLILWKEWENLANLEKNLEKKAWSQVKVTVKEIKNPDLNAKIVGFSIANQIEKRMAYKRAIKQAISKSMEKWAKGIKVKIWWRLNGVEISRKETFKEWNIPTQTIRADIDYSTVRAETTYGTLWIKVWIYKWDIFKKK